VRLADARTAPRVQKTRSRARGRSA
jgi:hypothetical protein